jgi:uncharacterized repeat protein (TIGR01451 family)
VAICLGGAFLALLGFLLASSASADYVFQVGHPAATPDLIISVLAGDETVLADEVISYTLMYTNTLSYSLEDVVISSTLSSKQYYSGTYLSDPLVPGADFTYDGEFDEGYTLTWQLGTISATSGGWIVVTTTLPPEAEPPWDDRKQWPLLGASAVITTSTEDVETGNPLGQEGDSASVMVVGPVLRIIKADNSGWVRPGRLLTYTLTVQNKDREDAIAGNEIVITDPVPELTTFYSASGTGVYSPTGDVVVWHLPDPLEPGNSVAVSFTVRLTQSTSSCPPPKVTNENYHVSTDETVQPVTGDAFQTRIDDVLEKTIETPDPPSGEQEVFPGGIIAYTISVFNPLHDQPLTGVRLTDTLPGTPNLFTFQEMLDGGPSPVSTYPEVVWDNLSVPAGGVTNLRFRVQVPYQIRIDANKTYRDYKNNQSASVARLNICEMADKELSKARGTRQIEMKKVVNPNHVLSGEIVSYTITLQNVGDTPINGIRLTDTLPNTGGADFYFVQMVEGPQPEPGYDHNPVV